MLKGSLLFAHAGLLIAAGAGFWIGDLAGLGNAVIGGAMVVLFFVAGQGVQLWAGELDPRTGMGVTVTSFLVRAMLLGAALWVVQRSPELTQAFRPVPFVIGVGLVLVAWLAGMFWAHSQLRVPVYDDGFKVSRDSVVGHDEPPTTAV